MKVGKTLHKNGNEATARKSVRRKGESTVGARIIEGLEQAIAWSQGKEIPVQVTRVQVPEVDVRKVRQSMGLTQAAFAMKFGLPPATLQNWEQGDTSVFGCHCETPGERGRRVARLVSLCRRAGHVPRLADMLPSGDVAFSGSHLAFCGGCFRTESRGSGS
jgi:DNA-binding transcriptional regulator YiaG